MADVLNVEARDSRGTQKARQMRREGRIPAVLYGHGEGNVALTVAADEFKLAIRHGAHMVDLQGAVSESAMVKNVQWDPFGNEVIHVDLTRVKKGEKVEVELNIELRGVAPGTKAGGTVEQTQRSVTVLCPAVAIPEKLELSINSLELGQTLTAADLELPEGAELITDADTSIANCHEPKAESDDVDEAGPADGAEPEVIGGSKEDEGGDA